MVEPLDLTERTLGNYKVLRRLGRGATADVYLAEQLDDKRFVAIKVLRSDLLQGQRVKLLQRFKQEAKAAGALAHPNIVQSYEISESDGIHYIAQEYVQGRNLQTYMKEEGIPSLPQVLHIMKCVGLALQAAGEAGIIHRDIKPDNILLTHKGEVKVADFGLAQLVQPVEGEAGLTQVGTTLGTPMYMSPEQVKGSRLDHRSDLYSLGVTSYHMLAGRPPFMASTPMAVAIKHVHEDAKSLKERRPDIPTGLCQIVEKLMQKDPAKRYSSAMQMLKDLKKVATYLKQREQQAKSGNATRPKATASSETIVDAEAAASPPGSDEPQPAAETDQRTGGRATGAAAEAADPLPTRPDWLTQQDQPAPRKIIRSAETTAASAEQTQPAKPRPPGDDDDGGFSVRPASTEFEEMDLTPMVDVTFLLLIFFMITASFSIQKTIQVPAPDPDKQGAAQSVQSLEELETEAIIVEIDEENAIIVDDEPVSDPTALVDLFSSKMINEQKNELVLEAASAALHDTVIRVIDAANEVNIERVRLVTRTEE